MVELILSDDKLTLALPESPDYYVKPLVFPWEHITGAELDKAKVARDWHTRLLFISTAVPEVIRPGVYYDDGDNVFWGIDNPDQVIAISLNEEPYKQLFIEVENPLEAVEIIENALKEREGKDAQTGDENQKTAGNLSDEKQEEG